MSELPKKMTIQDIADIAGVSKSTVSRVLDGNERISEETRKRVFEIIERYGYIPNSAARNLARNKTHAIGIVMPHGESGFYSTTFFQEIMNGICYAVSNYNYEVLITAGNPSETEAINRLASTSRVDGLVLLRPHVDDENVKLLQKLGFPFVLVGTCLENRDIYSVDNDNVAAAYDLTNHMIECGKRRIAFIGGKENAVFIVKRLEGYRKSLENRRIKPRPEYIKVGQFSEEHGYESMKELMELPQPPDAVIVMDDTMCMGAVNYLSEKNINIPDEISIACFNDSTYTRYSKPAITAISVDARQLGAEAAEMLIKLLENKKVEKGCKYVDYKLILRESTIK